MTYGADAPDANAVLEGEQTTTQLLPWTFQAGTNVDVSPHLELGAELRYYLYRQYQHQHTDITGIFLLHELDTVRTITTRRSSPVACASTISRRCRGSI